VTPDIVNELVDDLYAESVDDFVGLWEVTGVLSAQRPEADDDELRRLGALTVQGLVDAGLLIGDLVSGRGFVPWDDPLDVGRVMAMWHALGRLPNMGDDICWFARPGA